MGLSIDPAPAGANGSLRLSYRLICRRLNSPRLGRGTAERSRVLRPITSVTFRETMISPEALALLGGGKIAYVKTIRSEDVRAMFPQAPELKPGMQLLHCTWPTAR